MPRFGRILGRSGRALGGSAGAAAGAVGGVLDIISGIVSQLQQFVQALSPSTVALFSQAIKDLNATIGQAFQPAFVSLAGIIRSIADQVSPLMQRLAPVIQEVVQLLGERFVTGLNVAIGVVQSIVPIFQSLFEALSPLLEASQSLTLAMVSVLSLAIIPLATLITAIRPVIDGVVKAFQELIKNLILAAVYLFKMIGWMAGIEAIVKSLQPQEGGRIVAAGPTQITGLEEITKQLATSAAQARGEGAAVSKEDEFKADLLKRIGDARDNQTTLFDFLMKEFLPEMVRLIIEAINKDKASAVLEGVGVPHSGASVAGPFLSGALNPVGGIISWFDKK